MQNTSIRNAAYTDAAALGAGIANAFIPLLTSYYDNGFNTYFAQPRWIINMIKKEFFYVCMMESKIVGGILICKNPDKFHLKVHTIYVDEELRNNGLAQYMLQYAENQHRDAVKWELETVAALTSNRHIYEKMGYTLKKEQKKINKKVTIVYYEKYVNRISE